MSIPEPLRNNPFRLRKRRSLNSMLYGNRQRDPIQAINNSRHYYGTPSEAGAFSPNYMSGVPAEYNPHPGFIHMPNSSYRPYDELQEMLVSDFGGTADEFRLAAMELAGFSIEHTPKYEDSVMTNELLQQQIEALRDENSGQILFGIDEFTHRIQEPDMNARHIQMAIEEARSGLFTNTVPEMDDEDLYETEASELGTEYFDNYLGAQLDIEDQDTMLDSVQPDGVGPENLLLDEPMDVPDAYPLQISESLEQIVDEGIQPMIEEDFGEPMEENIEPGEIVEPFSGLQPYDVPMLPQERYEGQMPDEMMDPYMMPGPWGPMPGPGPGGP